MSSKNSLKSKRSSNKDFVYNFKFKNFQPEKKEDIDKKNIKKEEFDEEDNKKNEFDEKDKVEEEFDGDDKKEEFDEEEIKYNQMILKKVDPLTDDKYYSKCDCGMCYAYKMFLKDVYDIHFKNLVKLYCQNYDVTQINHKDIILISSVFNTLQIYRNYITSTISILPDKKERFKEKKNLDEKLNALNKLINGKYNISLFIYKHFYYI